MYIERAAPGVENSIGDRRPTGLYVGLGVEVAATQNDFTQGTPLTTNRNLDLAIEGLGFFKVQVEDSIGGGVAYTRAGNFSLNADGELVLANDQGRRLDPSITIPNDAVSVAISSDGRVEVLQPGNTEFTEVGQIQLSAFVNPAGLKQVGENLWVETAASGEPLEGDPGTENRGRIMQGQLESSNVDPTYELIEMIRTQRSFEMNSNSIRAADATLQAIAQLRR
jgi:flagellar basal-body rod protein FlgG